jgi:hypothetical protein
MAGEVKNSFRLLRDYLYEQMVAPLNQFSFWAYLILAVVVFGGLGVWVEINSSAIRPKARGPFLLPCIPTFQR